MSDTYTRRDLLKRLGFASPVALATSTAGAVAAPGWRPGAGPRLFFSAEELPRLRRLFAEDLRFAPLRESLHGRDKRAEQAFLRSGLNFNDQLKNLSRVGDCAQEMAFLYLMTGDEAAADLAIEAVRTLMQFPGWDFFADEKRRVVGVQRAPSSTISMACAIDWLGTKVEEGERKTWLTAVGERGCEPCFRGLESIRNPRKNLGWDFNPDSDVYEERKFFPTDLARRAEITQDTNLRAAPAGGLAVGAALLALHGDPSGSVSRWLEMATVSLQAFERIYLPDGSYGEGIHYANYTSESILVGLAALRGSGLSNLNLDINWEGHVEYMLNLSMATVGNPYEVVNIGDNGQYRDPARFLHPNGKPESRSAVPYWVAREFRSGRARWFAENLAASHDIWSLVFCDDTVTPVAPQEGAKTWYPDLDWVVARTGYEAEDLVVSLRSGIGFNHEHADRNSIIVKCYGEQLIVDPLRPPYWFRDPAWVMRLTEGHSAVLVDGQGHLHHNGVEGTNATIAQARIVGKGAGLHYSYWISDATQAYRVANANIRKVLRVVVVCFDLPAILLVDCVAKWHDAAQVEARFFGDNWDGLCQLSGKEDGFRIRRPGAFADARVFCRDQVTVAMGRLPIPVERAEKHPYLSVKTAPTLRTTLVSAVGLGRPGDEPISTRFDATDVQITATLRREEMTVVCRIDDSGDVPVIEVETA